MLFTERKSDHFWLRYGQKHEILSQSTPQKTGGAFIEEGAFIGERTLYCRVPGKWDLHSNIIARAMMHMTKELVISPNTQNSVL